MNNWNLFVGFRALFSCREALNNGLNAQLDRAKNENDSLQQLIDELKNSKIELIPYTVYKDSVTIVEKS